MRRKSHILVIDDNPILSSTLTLILKRARYEVTTLINTSEACQFLKDHTCDLIILDINEADTNNSVMALEIHVNFPGIPVVLLVCNNTLDPVSIWGYTSICSYLVKPVDPLQIIACVKNILGNPTPAHIKGN